MKLGGNLSHYTQGALQWIKRKQVLNSSQANKQNNNVVLNVLDYVESVLPLRFLKV